MSNAHSFVNAPLVLAEVSDLLIGFAVVAFVLVSLLMMLVVLIQKPQGGGLSGAFGAGAPEVSGQTAFGAKTGDVLTTATIGIFIVFLGAAVGLNFLVGPPRAPQEAAQVQPAETAPVGLTTDPAGGDGGAFNFDLDITDEPAGDGGAGGTETPAP
jgi:preprotein translocase subunit SecG